MILCDWIALAVLVVAALIGALLGFGKCLKLFSSGIFGIIISIFLCYVFGGLILGLPFVQNLLTKFAALWNTKEGFFFDLLTKIRMEIIVYYVALFIVAQILRIILVKILKHVFEIKFIVIKIINKIGGAVLFAGMILLLGLFVFQIIYWVQGLEGGLATYLESSNFVGALYRNNPLAALVNYVSGILTGSGGEDAAALALLKK